MRLIIVRHGQTEGNISRIMQGHSPGVLSDLGKKQARKLAQRLKNEKIDLIISSDLARALDTAKIVAEFHPDIELIIDKRIRERYIGSLEGSKYKDGLEWDNVPEDVEKESMMLERTTELFDETLKNNFEKTVVFVAHAGINCALLGGIIDKDLAKISKWRKQGNTCVNIIEIDKEGDIDIKLLNCTEHLK